MSRRGKVVDARAEQLRIPAKAIILCKIVLFLQIIMLLHLYTGKIVL